MGEERSDARSAGRSGRGAIDALVRGLVEAERHALDAERLADAAGLLQRFDPRIKLVALFALIVGAVATRSLTTLAVLFLVAVALAALSGISPVRLGRQVWAGVLLFSGLVVLPALVLVPGEAVAQLPFVGWTITLQGLRSAAFVIGRAETAATLALLLVLTTPWPHVLKALSGLGVPAVIVAILGMTYRYIFVLMQAARDMMEARRSRVLAPTSGRERRRLLLTAAGMLLARTLALGTEVHFAMIARGYRGEIRLLHDFRTAPFDWMFLALALTVPVVITGWQL